MFDTKDHRLQLESVQLLLRVYRPRATARDVLFYFHGGGWSLLNLDCFDRVMREYADATKCCVVGIEFPQAPEHPYPLAINAICFLLDRWKIIGRDLGFNHERFAFAGDFSWCEPSPGRVFEKVGRTQIHSQRDDSPLWRL